MPVNLEAPQADQLSPVAGIRIGVAQAGIRKVGKTDLCVFFLDEGVSVSGVFTKNRFCAAPVQICRAHLGLGSAPEMSAVSSAVSELPSIRALVINTGNANAGTGADGLNRSRQTCEALAQLLGLQARQVLPFSTGVIMEPLPVDRVVAGFPAAIANAKEDNWLKAATAIMTTDTVPKAFSAQAQIGDKPVQITGISKGAGMIRPNMATMLGFMATDAKVSPTLVHALAFELAEASFNRVTVDGDTSTNDSFVVMASGKAGNAEITSLTCPDGQALKVAMMTVAKQLAQAIVRDGEGATKFITVQVDGGKDAAECRRVAYAIAHSPLVKTAFFASDPNLGRILAAVGYAGIEDLDQTLIEMHLDDVHVATQGGRNPAYLEADGQRVMKKSEILVKIDLGRGKATDTVWTCDLSHDYVTINADYRS